MARLVLHIGAAQSGADCLQRWMACNRDVLRQAGIVCPGTGSDLSHDALFAPWIDADRPAAGRFAPLRAKAAGIIARLRGTGDDAADAQWRGLVRDHAGKAGTLFLSAPSLSRAGPRPVDFAALADRLRDFDDVRIVYVARRQPDLIQEVWLDLAMSGAAPDMGPFVDDAMRDHRAGGIWLDHGRVLDAVGRGFDPDRVTVLDHDHVRRDPAGTIVPLLGCHGTPDGLVPLPDGGQPDPLARWIACRIASPSRPDAGLTSTVAEAMASLPPDTRGCALSRREYALIAQAFAPLNAALTARLQPTQPGFRLDAGQGPPASLTCRDALEIPFWVRLARGVQDRRRARRPVA